MIDLKSLLAELRTLPKVRFKDLPPQMRASLLAERRKARIAAKAFTQACAGRDADALFQAVDLLNEEPDSWRLAFTKVAELTSVRPEIQQAFLEVWVESKMLASRVGDRRTSARALRLLFPGGYDGPPMTLYRGADSSESRYRRHGFSWTIDRDVARAFARLSQQAGLGGVVLETVAPPEAVLLIREPENYYDEGEVVLDPFRLGRVSVAERLE